MSHDLKMDFFDGESELDRLLRTKFEEDFKIIEENVKDEPEPPKEVIFDEKELDV